MKLTDRKLKSLKPRSYTYDVNEGKGFGVRVTPTGAISFAYTYKIDGKRHRVSLGRYPGTLLADARRVYKNLYGSRLQGGHPAAEKKTRVAEHQKNETLKRNEGTLAELATKFIDRYSRPNKRTWKEDERLLAAVINRLGDMPVKAVERRHVVALLDDMAERAPVVANRTLAVMRKMFNWAASRGEVESSPVAGIAAPGGKETPRHRFLQSDEIADLVVALDNTKTTPALVATIRFLLASGQRRSEVLNAAWEEFDLNLGWWEIPTDRVKNATVHRVPITESMRRILDSVRGQHSTWVFLSPISSRPYEPDAPNRVISRLFERKLLKGERFTLHDLRRTMATNLGDAGFMDDEIGLLLNHTRPGVTQRYNRSTHDTIKRRMANAWDRRLKAIFEGRDPVAKVVPLR